MHYVVDVPSWQVQAFDVSGTTEHQDAQAVAWHPSPVFSSMYAARMSNGDISLIDGKTHTLRMAWKVDSLVTAIYASMDDISKRELEPIWSSIKWSPDGSQLFCTGPHNIVVLQFRP